MQQNSYALFSNTIESQDLNNNMKDIISAVRSQSSTLSNLRIDPINLDFNNLIADNENQENLDLIKYLPLNTVVYSSPMMKAVPEFIISQAEKAKHLTWGYIDWDKPVLFRSLGKLKDIAPDILNRFKDLKYSAFLQYLGIDTIRSNSVYERAVDELQLYTLYLDIDNLIPLISALYSTFSYTENINSTVLSKIIMIDNHHKERNITQSTSIVRLSHFDPEYIILSILNPSIWFGFSPTVPIQSTVCFVDKIGIIDYSTANTLSLINMIFSIKKHIDIYYHPKISSNSITYMISIQSIITSRKAWSMFTRYIERSENRTIEYIDQFRSWLRAAIQEERLAKSCAITKTRLMIEHFMNEIDSLTVRKGMQDMIFLIEDATNQPRVDTRSNLVIPDELILQSPID